MNAVRIEKKPAYPAERPLATHPHGSVVTESTPQRAASAGRDAFAACASDTQISPPAGFPPQTKGAQRATYKKKRVEILIRATSRPYKKKPLADSNYKMKKFKYLAVVLVCRCDCVCEFRQIAFALINPTPVCVFYAL